MKQLESDVIIIAGGMSGLCAAAAAAERGASVTVFEKTGTVGGAANMGMGFFAVESHIQKANLIGLTVDEAFMRFMNFNHWKADAALVHKLYAQSGSTVKWIEDMGVEWLGAFKYFDDSEATWHVPKVPGSSKPVPRCASIIVKAIYDYAAALGVQFVFNTTVKRIEYNGTRVTGVYAVGADGTEYAAESDAVIVCTGGFGDSPEMIEQYMGYRHGDDLFSFRIPGLKGEGMKMAWDIGAGRTPMVMEMTYETPARFGGAAIDTMMRQPNLVVNRLGRRFFNEDMMSITPFAGNAIARQKDRVGYSILSSDVVEFYRAHGVDCNSYHKHMNSISEWDDAVQNYLDGGQVAEANPLMGVTREEKFFFVADSVEDLAAQLGIDPAELARTVARYNEFCGTGRDLDFGKKARYLHKLTGEKFYACKYYPSGYGSLGGIKTDDRLQVIREDFSPIPGLFSAGTDCCTIFGDTYMFYFPGSTMGFAVNSGRMAGYNAVEFLDTYEFED